MSSYNILSKMVQAQGTTSRSAPVNPFANGRVAFIANYLKANGIPTKIDYFTTTGARTLERNSPEPKFVNFYINPHAIKSGNNVTVFLAHHDIVNASSQNVQDNSASVCNLLELANRVKGRDDVCIAIVDAEEIVSFTSSGSKRLARVIKHFGTNVKEFLNLELTAVGTGMHREHTSILCNDLQLISTPYNDATVLRHAGFNNAVCIGILPETELEIVMKKGYCDTWRLCHSAKDTIDKASAEDMAAFVDYLYSLV